MPSPAVARIDWFCRIRRSKSSLSAFAWVMSCIWITKYSGSSPASRTREALTRPDGSPSLVEVALLQVEILDLPQQQTPQAFQAPLEVVGVGDALEVRGEQLLFGVAGDLAHRRVDLQPSSLRGGKGHAERR